MTEPLVLDDLDQRVLGSLMEKQTTVPDTYPLTANALRSACNQTSSREPVLDLDLDTVERTARALKDRGLLRIVWAPTGRRTLKYHQILDERLGLEADERALLTVLLLRGEQTPGELRARTERLHRFADRDDVEECLRRMAAREPEPLVRELERRPGQHDQRWVHLLGPGAAGGHRDPVAATRRGASGAVLRGRSTARRCSPVVPSSATRGCGRRTTPWPRRTPSTSPTSWRSCPSRPGCSTASRRTRPADRWSRSGRAPGTSRRTWPVRVPRRQGSTCRR